jgi:hypothetical protein
MDKYVKISTKLIAASILALFILSACAAGISEENLPIKKPTLEQTATLTKFASTWRQTYTPSKTIPEFFTASTELPHINLDCKKPS